MPIKKGIFKKCEICNIKFYVYPYAIKIRKYCSNKCKRIAYQENHPKKGSLTKGEIIKCLICQKNIKIYRHKTYGDKKYCSNRCYYIGGKTKFNKEKQLRTTNETVIATNNLIQEIKNKGNRVLVPDKKPRPDVIEIDFKNKKIIAYEIETNKCKLTRRKIYLYREQFVKEKIVYDKVIVQTKDKRKIVWQNFPAKNIYFGNKIGDTRENRN